MYPLFFVIPMRMLSVVLIWSFLQLRAQLKILHQMIAINLE